MDFQLTNNSVRGDNAEMLTTTRREIVPPLLKWPPTIKNYPTNIHYGDMSNDTLAEKERLLKRWTFS